MSEFDPTGVAPEPSPRSERLTFAVRQAALLGFALAVAGLVTESLRPDEAFGRGMASTAFLWAIVIWFAVLVLNAVAYERSQMASLEQKPLYAAAVVGACVFLVGLVSFNGGGFGRRVVYLFANGLGALMFWWAVFSVGHLITRLPD